MDCREFHETYTDLLDGRLGETDEVRFHKHLAVCSWCRRFDRAYRLGVSVLQDLPCPRSSRAFTTRVLHAVRTDQGSSRVSSFASGLAGAALVVALILFFAVDLRVLDHRELVASANFTATTAVAPPPDSTIDPITFRLGDVAYPLPFWDPYATFQVHDAALSSRVRFAVPTVWTGR